MSQKTITLSCDQSGTTYTTELNLALEAMDSMHSGDVAPTTNIADGKFWLDTSVSDNVVKILIGATWHVLWDFDGSDFFAKRAESATNATLAAAATKLETARLVGGISFDGTVNIDLPGVNADGNQNTSGTAANAMNATTATTAQNLTGTQAIQLGNLPGGLTFELVAGVLTITET